MTLRTASARGFTLIEMAIVIVVIGLVLSGGLIAVTPILQGTKTTATNQKLDRIEQALTLYAIRYGCLPCPADPTIATGSASAGEAHGATGYYPITNAINCDTSCNAAVTAQGIVPWIALGLSEDDAVDGFGYRIDYAVTPALVATNGMVRTPPSSYPSGTLEIDNIAGAEQTGGVGSRAAYVLISHGSDHSLAYSRLAVQSIDPHGSTPQKANSDGSPFVQDDLNDVAATYFDDIVRWRTAPMVIQLCGTNACGNPA